MLAKPKGILKKAWCRVIGAGLTLAMVCTMLPMTVFAVENKTPTRTTTLDVSALTETTDMLNSEGWKWVPDADGGTLTLRNCYIRTQGARSIHFPDGNVTIMLEGKNTIETMSNSWAALIWSDGAGGVAALNLTIAAGTKDGKLNILRKNASSGMTPYAIAGNTINIQSGDIYANTEFCVIKSNFTMQGGSLKIDVANVSDGNGIYSVEGNVNISGGNLDIDAGQIGIFIPGNTNIGEQKASLTGGDVKIRGGLDGITAKNITIDTNGELDIQGIRAALYCSKTGGTLEILSAGSLTLAGGKPYLPESSDGDKTVTIGNADYSAIDGLINEANALDPDHFITDLSGVTAAIHTVVRNKSVLEQNTVNGYATAIKNAIAALVYKGADYTKVDEALAKIPSDLSIYTDASVKTLNDAKNAVDRDKNITEQATVDSYAAVIEAAVADLKKKLVVSITNPESGAKIEYEDGSAFDDGVSLSVTSKPKSEMNKYKDAVNKAAPGLTLGGLYDISLLKDGMAIQPNGKVKVAIPLTGSLAAMSDVQVVYIDDNGNATVVPSEIKDGKIVFVTDHFSYYGVVGKVKTTPATGDTVPILPLTLLVLAFGTGLVILGEKRKILKHLK